MRSPSARIIVNQVTVYTGALTQDADAAPQWSYAGPPKLEDVSCSIQVGSYEEVFDQQERLCRVNSYTLFFTFNPGIVPRDLIVWVDTANITHTLFVQQARDEAGRGTAFTVKAIERI